MILKLITQLLDLVGKVFVWLDSPVQKTKAREKELDEFKAKLDKLLTETDRDKRKETLDGIISKLDLDRFRL